MGRTKGASRRLTPASRPKTARQREATTKRRGELAELAFVYKAASLGFGVAKPYGDSERYDFILDSGSRLWRIQVKSTSTLLNGMYHVNSHRRINGAVVPYRPPGVDFGKTRRQATLSYDTAEAISAILHYVPRGTRLASGRLTT